MPVPSAAVGTDDGRVAGRRRLVAALAQLALELCECGQCRQRVPAPRKDSDVYEGDAVGQLIGRVAEVARVDFREGAEHALDQARVLLGRVGSGPVTDDHGLAHVRISPPCAETAAPRWVQPDLSSTLAFCK